MGLFANKRQYKAAHHVHTTNSPSPNGAARLIRVVEEHYKRGFDIVAITDHNFLTREWPTTRYGPALARVAEMAVGVDRNGRSMLMIIETMEQSGSDHICTFLMDSTTDGTTLLPNATAELILPMVTSRNGLAHLNHTGRTKGDSQITNNTLIDRYVGLLRACDSCVGVEIVNSPIRYRDYNDREMWDILNTRCLPQRLVWGFANDDSHANEEIGFAFNMMVMAENSEVEFRMAMERGSFYAVSRVIPTKTSGVYEVNNRNLNAATPIIRDIEVSGAQIAIAAENYNAIDWITEGTHLVGTGATMDVSALANSFIRANVVGTGGIAFTQPFRVVGGNVVIG